MKNLSRLTALLLALVMLLGVTASATEISNLTKADYDNLVAAQSELAEIPALTATDSGFNFAVAGEVPENAQLYVTYMGEDTTANIRTSFLGLPELEEGMSEYAFDITIVENNAEWQPGTPVEVTITGIDATEDSEVKVYHIPDSAQPAVATLSLTDEDLTPVMAFEEVEATAKDGAVTFMADGFSIYYVTTTGQNTGESLANGESHTLYMVRGTSATMTVNSGATCSGSTNEITATISSSGYSNRLTITAATDAQIGSTAAITVNWTQNSRDRSATVYVEIVSEEEIETKEVLNKINNTSYPFYVAVRVDGKMPNEPSVQASATYLFFRSSGQNYTAGTGFNQFASSAQGLVSEDIVYHEKFFFEPYYAGEKVVGLVDGTGVAIRDMISGVDWDKVLQAAAANGTANAIVKNADGTEETVRVTSSNVSDFTIVPYVVKLQEDNGTGWHVDCAIVPKAAVILDYRLNIPDGVTLNTTIGLPNQQTGLPPADFDIGGISGLSTINEGGSTYQNAMRVTYMGESYVFYFLGWDTKPDGTGTRYQPGDTMEDVEKNTTLYAIWNSNPLLGTGDLKITKLVAGQNADTTKMFTFRIDIANEAEGTTEPTYKYTVYNSNDVAAGRNGTIKNGGEVWISHSQYVIIEDIPAQNDENGAPNVTVTEVIEDGYTPSWEGGEGASTTVKIEGGRRSEITCTNTIVPQLADLTIKKTDLDVYAYDKGTTEVDRESAIFTVTATDKNGTVQTYVISLANGQSVTIKDLQIGSSYTITEQNDWTWRYATEPAVSGTIAEGGSSETIKNDDPHGYWLGGDNYKVNKFGEAGPGEPVTDESTGN